MEVIEMHDGQTALFDLAMFEREEIAATPWDGAPLRYTTAYYSPDELDRAFERYIAENGRFGCMPKSHMWHRAILQPSFVTGNGHSIDVFTADRRTVGAGNEVVNGDAPRALMTQIICSACQWHHITESEATAVEAWHDHALPGWQNLPILPGKLANFDSPKHRAAVESWMRDHYPESWLIDGTPVLTLRKPPGTRHVPSRSPLGGYDLAIIPSG